MRVLGFDPSLTHFGWCLVEFQPGSVVCVDRGEFKTTPGEIFIDRYTGLRERVRCLLQTHPDALVSSEYSVFGETYSEGMYGVYLYLCEALRLERKRVVFWSPHHLKAQARSHLGRPPGWVMAKSDMVEAARKHSGSKSPPWTEHQADAYWAAFTGGRFWDLYQGGLVEDELTPLEQDQFVDIRVAKRGRRAGQVDLKGALFKEGKRFFLWDQDDGKEERTGGSQVGNQSGDQAGTEADQEG